MKLRKKRLNYYIALGLRTMSEIKFFIELRQMYSVKEALEIFVLVERQGA